MCATRFHIYFYSAHSFSHRPRRKDVIDSPAFVLIQRTRFQVIPECELLPFWIKPSKYINEAPRQRFFVRAANVCMKANVAEMFFRAMDVDWFGCDVHVAAPHGRLIR